MPKKINIYSLLILLILMVFGRAFAEQFYIPSYESGRGDGTPYISVTDTASVKGEKIFLKDIAAIHTGASSEKVGNIQIELSPKPGKTKAISGRWVFNQMKAQRIISPGVKVDIPETIYVTRECQVISEDQLMDILYDFLETEMPEANFKINNFKVRGDTVFPVGRLRFTVDENYRTRNRRCVNLPVWVEVDGDRVDNMILSAIVDIHKEVVCVEGYAKRGTILTAGDIVKKEINISKAPPDVIYDENDVIGKRMKSSLREGAFIRLGQLEVPPLIVKGDKIKMVAQKGALSVVSYGIAQANGLRGEQIEVENISSKKIVVGRVKNASTVEIIF